MMTTVGALPVLFGGAPSERMRDALLGFAAGVMLAASFFSLIIPSIDISTERFGDGALPAAIACAGILIGVIAVAMINRYMPHEHFIKGREGPDVTSLRRIWLFVIAITIHNFPEGLAVGVGFGGGDVANGIPLAIGIGLQNAPEGLAVAVALVGERYGRLHAFLIATLTGLVEPIGGLVGAAAVALAESLLPWGLAFAAGAMLYVISHEIIPETHRRGFANEATTGLTIGLVVMLFLDVWLGA
ncbi:MAG: ZIP family metal transporter [Alphaproteobacteria bacterium]